LTAEEVSALNRAARGRAPPRGGPRGGGGRPPRAPRGGRGRGGGGGGRPPLGAARLARPQRGRQDDGAMRAPLLLAAAASLGAPARAQAPFPGDLPGEEIGGALPASYEPSGAARPARLQ